MKNSIVIVLLALIIILIGFGVYKNTQRYKNPSETVETADQSLEVRFGNLAYSSNQWPLKNGIYTRDCPADQALCEGEVFSVTLTKSVLVDLNKDNVMDGVVILKPETKYNNNVVSSFSDVVSAVINNTGSLKPTEPFEIAYELKISEAKVSNLSVNERGDIIVSILRKDTVKSSPVAQNIILHFDQKIQRFVLVR